ncbi:MAG: hypothetical protein AABY11_02210, partial [archaeon]
MNTPRAALVCLLLLLTSPLTMAMPRDGFSNSETLPSISPRTEPLATVATPQDILISFQATPSGGVCRFSELDPEEVQRLKDLVLTPGLVGDEISAGTPVNTDRDVVSDNNKLLIPNPYDDETAFQKNVPVEKLSPEELSPLQNQRIRGPFAFGLSLDDSLRAARCVDDATCAVLGEQLQYRNSGEGLKGVTKNIYESIVGDSAKDNPILSPEESEILHAQIESGFLLGENDANTLEVDTLQRVKTPKVMNHIRADNTWQAAVLTNCEGDCILTLYSMFDRYFNAWFSAEMVVGTFSPTLIGQFRKLAQKSPAFKSIRGTFNKINPLAIYDRSQLQGFLKKGGVVTPSDFFKKSDSVNTFKSAIATMEKDPALQPIFAELFSKDKKILSSAQFQGWETTAFGPEGSFSKITDPDVRKKAFTFFQTLQEYTSVIGGVLDDVVYTTASGVKVKLKDIAKTPGVPDDVRLKVARQYAAMMKDFDDTMHVNLVEEYLQNSPATGLSSIFIKNNAGQYIELSGKPSAYINEINEKFYKDPNFANVGDVEKFTNYTFDPVNNKYIPGAVDPTLIQIYRAQDNVPVLVAFDIKKLEAGEYDGKGWSVKLSDGRNVAATPGSANTIKAAGGTPTLVTASYAPMDEPLNPSKYAEIVLAGEGEAGGKFSTMKRHVESINTKLINEEYGSKTYTNLLSKQLQQQNNIIKNYFSFWQLGSQDSGLWWTAKAYSYWIFTRGGIGPLQTDFTLYRLPDQYTEVSFIPGETGVYADAYIDFFAQEGSDIGDIFQKFIENALVLNQIIIEPLADNYPFIDNAWNYLNGGGSRTTVENLAIFVFGAGSCPECSVTPLSSTDDRFSLHYTSGESLNAFFIEDALDAEAKEEGQLLSVFAHHADVEGKVKGEALGDINLARDREEGNTCEQVIANVPGIGWISR